LPISSPDESGSDLPAGNARAGHQLLGLAGGGVCPAKTVTSFAVRSYRTFSPLPVPYIAVIGCVFSAALSRGLPRVAVNHHRALSCSDFPHPHLLKCLKFEVPKVVDYFFTLAHF